MKKFEGEQLTAAMESRIRRSSAIRMAFLPFVVLVAISDASRVGVKDVGSLAASKPEVVLFPLSLHEP